MANEYYFNKGYLVTGRQAIDGSNYFFLPNEVLFAGVIKNAKVNHWFMVSQVKIDDSNWIGKSYC